MAADPRAHAAVAAAVGSGRLAPASARMCEDCGETAAIYHHHAGYAQPNWLDVVPLCSRCHIGRHGPPRRGMQKYRTGRRGRRIMLVTVRLPEEVHSELVEVAREQRRSLNTALVVAAERYVRQMKARQPKEDR
jgi:hypothetical protein